MTKLFVCFLLACCLALQNTTSVIMQHVLIKISTYEKDGQTKAYAMPELKLESELIAYKKRFEYLLLNVSAIHQPENAKDRKAVWELYPDTVKLKQEYLSKFAEDKKLVRYFEETIAPIANANMEVTKSFEEDDLLEVASKFFYCDKVMPDTSVQTHICIGLNGVGEANWKNDFTLLEAFCFEAIFNDVDKDKSPIMESLRAEKKESYKKYRNNITNLDEYLQNVKMDVFEKMKNSKVLKKVLLAYYKMNENNLAFKIYQME